MKKHSLIAVAALSLFAAQAHAGAATSNFNVNVTLTTLCQVKTASTGLDFAYTAFQGSASTATPTAVVFECTRGFTNPPTVVLDSSGTDATSGSAGQGVSGAGHVRGLQYTIAVAAGSKTTTGTAASTASIGSADEYTFAITGSMASGQAGDSSKAATQVRTLTLAY
jgi:hypothetical protein